MTKKLTIEFLQFNKPKRNGDRATRDTDCYDFEIKLNGNILQKFSQYTPWWESVSSYDDALREATKYAEDLADTLDLKRPKLVTMVSKETHKIEWVPGGPSPKACHHADHHENMLNDGQGAGDQLAEMWEKGHRENRDNG